jgi:isopentenyldiphosphate isomerase
MEEELIDVLDSTGAPTGVRKAKREIHRDGDWHRAAHVWIMKSDGRVLLQKRATAKENWPGWWDVSAAGHCSAGESAVDTALREVSEELGLALDARELTHVATLRDSVVLNGGAYIDNEIHEVFLVRRDVDLRSLTLQPGEVDDVALVAVGELLSRTDLVPHRSEHALVHQLASATT